MRTVIKPRPVSRENGRTTYESTHAKRAWPLARVAFATWGLMSEIIGASLVVFGLFTLILMLTAALLVLFF
jgi:hypothetical protein